MTTLPQAIRVLEDKAAEDPALAEAVKFLATASTGPADPFADPGSGVLAAARAVNERRQGQRSLERMQRAVDTGGVVEIITSINDRKGVDRRRHRGQLLGWKVGRATMHPIWQFDRSRGDTRPGLERVLAALRDVTDDPIVADALMSAPRSDLGGATLADLFARGRVETTIRLILSAGDQS